MLKTGDIAPDFSLRAESGKTFKLSDFYGERLLLVFYPGDNTPVCTRQLCDYRDNFSAFEGLGVRVVGISPDGEQSHQQFKSSHDLPFTLLSDPHLAVAEKYDSKGILGMKRSVFLVDESGVLRYVHVESMALFRRKSPELLAAVSELNET